MKGKVKDQPRFPGEDGHRYAVVSGLWRSEQPDVEWTTIALPDGRERTTKDDDFDRAAMHEVLHWRCRAEALERSIDEQQFLLDATAAALRGEEVSDFEESFGIVRLARDLFFAAQRDLNAAHIAESAADAPGTPPADLHEGSKP